MLKLKNSPPPHQQLNSHGLPPMQFESAPRQRLQTWYGLKKIFVIVLITTIILVVFVLALIV